MCRYDNECTGKTDFCSVGMDGNGYARYAININENVYKNIFNNHDMFFLKSKIPTCIFRIDNICQITDSFNDIRQKSESNENTIKHLAKLQVLLLMYDVITKSVSKKIINISKNRYPSEEIIFVLNYIECHFNENISLEFICKMLHISRSTFYREFTKSVGLPLKRYITSLRTINAINMLEQGEKISKTAERNGFSSIAAMRREIKQVYGIIPKNTNE